MHSSNVKHVENAVPAQPGRRVTEWRAEREEGEREDMLREWFTLLFLVMFLSSTSLCHFSTLDSKS